MINRLDPELFPAPAGRHGSTWDLGPDEVLAGHLGDRAAEMQVRVGRKRGVIEISGPDLPTARLLRTGDGMLEPGCLIGTREAGRLSLTVGDRPAEVAPGRGLVVRRSFRVDVRLGDVGYRLVPDSRMTSALYRDGDRVGRLTADPDQQQLSAEWSPGATVSPAEAVLGHLLAVSFGTGAANPLYLAFEFALCLVPF